MPTDLEQTVPWNRLDLEHDETRPWPRSCEVDDPACDAKCGVEASMATRDAMEHLAAGETFSDAQRP